MKLTNYSLIGEEQDPTYPSLPHHGKSKIEEKGTFDSLMFAMNEKTTISSSMDGGDEFAMRGPIQWKSKDVYPTSIIIAAIMPIRGIVYSLAHPSLICQIILPFVCCIIFTILVFVLLMVFAFYPQAWVLMHMMWSWLAYIISFILVVIETFLLLVIFTGIGFDSWKNRLHAKVFEIEGVQIKELSDDGTSLGNRAVMCLWDRIVELLILVVTLPINLIPFIGTVLYFCINGFLLAWRVQDSYFSTKGLSYKMQLAFVKERYVEYVAFGLVALTFSTIPFVNVIFMFTHVIGAALWAVEYEKNNMFYCGDVSSFLSDRRTEKEPLLGWEEDSNYFYGGL